VLSATLANGCHQEPTLCLPPDDTSLLATGSAAADRGAGQKDGDMAGNNKNAREDDTHAPGEFSQKEKNFI